MTRRRSTDSKTYQPLKSGAETQDARTRLDVHQAVTDKIIAAIEAGAGTFEMPWHRPGVAFTIPRNAATEKPYRGTNILALWIDAQEKKFEHQVWATYRQFAELGAQVRKGEKGSLIVKYGEWVPKDDGRNANAHTKARKKREAADTSDDDDDGKRLYAKPAWVFNIDQVDAPDELRARLAPAVVARADLTTRLAHVDAFIANTGAEFREGGQRAFYRHPRANGDGDFIQMPPRDLFTGTTTSTPTEAYESTRLHELGHWSGAEKRLNRDFGKRFGDQAYAFEEIVVEISAAMNCAHLGIANEPRLDHAQYIAHWLEILKGEKKAIFSAASLATQIVDYLHGLQPKPQPDPEPERMDTPQRNANRAVTATPSLEGPR